jgi:raffinose/stachyose/melibiose transport system permease protein
MTMNLPLYLYNKAMIENNYGYANAIGVFIIVCGIAIMRLINR